MTAPPTTEIQKAQDLSSSVTTPDSISAVGPSNPPPAQPQSQPQPQPQQAQASQGEAQSAPAMKTIAMACPASGLRYQLTIPGAEFKGMQLAAYGIHPLFSLGLPKRTASWSGRESLGWMLFKLTQDGYLQPISPASHSFLLDRLSAFRALPYSILLNQVLPYLEHITAAKTYKLPKLRTYEGTCVRDFLNYLAELAPHLIHVQGASNDSPTIITRASQLDSNRASKSAIIDKVRGYGKARHAEIIESIRAMLGSSLEQGDAKKFEYCNPDWTSGQLSSFRNHIQFQYFASIGTSPLLQGLFQDWLDMIRKMERMESSRICGIAELVTLAMALPEASDEDRAAAKDRLASSSLAGLMAKIKERTQV